MKQMAEKCCPRCEKSFDSTVETCSSCKPWGRSVHLLQQDELSRTPEGSRFLLGMDLDGRFRIEGYVGGGGMGTVYKARQLTVDREVALKVLRSELVTDPQIGDRFAIEARVVARLNNPHIIQLYDFGSDQLDPKGEPVFYMAMELVHGRSLAQLLKQEGMLAPSRAGLAQQAL